MNNFSELPLCTLLQSNLMKHGFVQPTPVQSEAVPPALAGRDVVATAQTGTGKTLAFLLPRIQSLAKPEKTPASGIRAIIPAPTLELAFQIHESALRRRGVNPGVAGLGGWLPIFLNNATLAVVARRPCCCR